jgi:hypothetical protein
MLLPEGSHKGDSMDLIKCIVSGLIGGAIGGAVWAALAYYTNFEFAIVAWGIGGLVGFCCRAGAGASSGVLTGLIAAGIALASIAGGKYAVVDIVVEREVAKVSRSVENTLDQHLTDDEAVLALADDLLIKAEEAGKKITWPKGKSATDERTVIEDFPAAIAKDAKSRWKAMSASARESYSRSVQDARRHIFNEEIAAKKEEVKSMAFNASFGIFDIVFGMLALLTAYKIGSDE